MFIPLDKHDQEEELEEVDADGKAIVTDKNDGMFD